MEDTPYINSIPPLTIEQIRDWLLSCLNISDPASL